MDKVYLKELLEAVRAELIRLRFAAVVMFLGISFSLLVAGLLWPKKYTTTVMLYSDITNIIEPLLKGRASVTEIDRSQQAKEIVYARSIMEAAARQVGLLNPAMTPEQKEGVIKKIRSGVQVKSEKNNYFSISYTDDDQDSSFEILYALTSVFIADTERKKREESVGAFNFIDAQVQSYKQQLEQAEEKLKDFKASNIDGSEAAVSARIAQLRIDIETLDLAIEESQSKIKTINNQLSSEGEYLQVKGQVEELSQRRQALTSQLESLLLSYQESYPDVISLRGQIAELDIAINHAKMNGEVFSKSVENPLFEELRKQQALAEVNLRAQSRRKLSLKKLLTQEMVRAQRVAANQAQLSELTRDYNVTRDVYEEMLQRKESARLSMTLDMEGQGVSYRIQDPATFPLKPSGLNFFHFAVVGPFLGLLMPMGLLLAYVMMDPHIRSTRMLQQQLPREILLIGDIPHFNTPLGTRVLRRDVIFLAVFSVVGMGVYISLAVYWSGQVA